MYYNIKLGKPIVKLQLGYLDAHRDWMYVPDAVNAMYKILELDYPDDFVISSGETHSIKEFLTEAFKCIGISDYNLYVDFNNPDFLRPNELHYLKGDSSKARKVLKWEPEVDFKQLVKKMVQYDVEKERLTIP